MKYPDYLDEDVLPGQVYRAKFGKGITFNPQSEPKDNGDLFQRFLALQNNPEALFMDTARIPNTLLNPEALFTNTARMPNTPFGNLGQYMGG